MVQGGGEYPELHGNEFHDMDTDKVSNINGAAVGRALLSSIMNGNQF